MERIKYKQILDVLESLDGWLAKLGIEPKNDRIHAAIDVMQRAQAGFEQLRATGQPAKIGNVEHFHFGIEEAHEFYDIFRAFEHEKPEVLKPKLMCALSGPWHPRDETKDNTLGRNTMFELSLAAEWRILGLVAKVGDPDITLVLNNVSFFVECKRPFDVTGIRPNVRGAARQLREKLDRQGAEAAVGIIAVSVTRMFNRGRKLYVVPTEKDVERLGDRVEKLMRESELYWAKLDHHPRIVAVLFHIATPGVVEDKDILARMRYTILMPTGKGHPVIDILRNALPRLY